MGSVEATLPALTTLGLAAFESGRPGVRGGSGRVSTRPVKTSGCTTSKNTLRGQMRHPTPAPAQLAGLRRVNPAAWRQPEISLDLTAWKPLADEHVGFTMLVDDLLGLESSLSCHV